MTEKASKSESDPWWHNDATEFAPDSGTSASEADQNDSGELLNTAAQEAIKLASTLSAWADQTGVGEVLRSMAQQAVDTAQEAANSFGTGQRDDDGTKETDETDLEPEATTSSDANEDSVAVADQEFDAEIDLASDEYAHLDQDPAAVVGTFPNPYTLGKASHNRHNGASGGGVEPRATCDFCPVCRAIDSLDDLNPETAAAIAEVMAVVTDGLTTAVMDIMSRRSPTE